MARFETIREIQFDRDSLTLFGSITFSDDDFIRVEVFPTVIDLFGDFSFGLFGDIDGSLEAYFLLMFEDLGVLSEILSIENLNVDIDDFEDAVGNFDPMDDYSLIFTGPDLILLSDGDDKMSGFGGRDQILGFEGDDTLIGGRGADTLEGGAGRDSLTGAAGLDEMYGGVGADTLTGGPDADRVFGGGGRDNLQGGAGVDRLAGQGQADILRGGAAADNLIGGGGADTLRGGGGDDRITAGKGADVIFGGAGDDVLIFTPSAGSNQVRDFHQGADRIKLEAANDIGDLDIEQTGRATTISFRALEIVLRGQDADDFDPSDFIF